MKRFNKLLSFLICVIFSVSQTGFTGRAAETSPFKKHVIPGIIKLSDFDKGGDGFAFKGNQSTSGNIEYRADADDKINFYADSDGGAYLGFLTGNWLVFTVNVAETAEYEVNIEAATPNDAKLSLAVDGNEAFVTDVEKTAGWSPMVESNIGTVKLTEGVHTIKFYMVSGGINVRQAMFTKIGGNGGVDKPYKNHYIPCIIQAEDFDNGAGGCISKDGKNSLRKYRASAMLDIGEIVKDKEFYLNLAEGEAAKYTFNVENAGAYAFMAATKSESDIELYFDDKPNPAKASLSSTGTYTEQEIVNIYLDEGIHSVTLKSVKGATNIDYLFVRNAVGDYYTLDNVGTYIEEESKEENVSVSMYNLTNNDIYKNIYVSVTGDDANDGSESSPFKTIDRAKEEVRKQRDAMTGDIVVNIMSGTYYISEQLSFTEEDGGNNGFNVIWQGVGDEKPIINGGTEIKGWTKQDNGIWVASCENIEDTRTLFIDDFAATRARSKYIYAAGDYVDDPDARGTSQDGFILTSNSGYLPDIEHNTEDVELAWELLWTLQRSPVKKIYKNKSNETVVIMDQPYFNEQMNSIAHTAPGKGKTFIIENALELLDEPGEFYFDKQEKKIYYYPYNAQNMETAKTYAGTAEFMAAIAGSSSESKINNFAFRNISFKYGAWNEANTTGCAVIQAGKLITSDGSYPIGGGKVLPAQINIEYAENIEISDCEFKGMGSTAIGLNNGVKNAGILGNVITDASGDAVSVGHFNHNNVLTEGQEPVSNVTVANNVIRRAGREYSGSAAVTIYYTANVNVMHNDIADVPYSCISIGWGWGAEIIERVMNNRIQYNKLADTCKLAADGAHIYTLGRQRDLIISDNFLEKSGDYRGGIYHDSGSGGITDYNNVVILDYNNFAKTNNWLFIPHTGTEGAYGHFNIYHNFSNISDCKQEAADAVFTDTTVVKDGNWPEEAIKIMSEAGVEDKYKKNLDGVDRPSWEIVNVGMIPDKQFEIDVDGGVYDATEYNPGGEGVGYHKTENGNMNHKHPEDAVAIMPRGDIPGYAIGRTMPGDWLEYDIRVNETDEYIISCVMSNAREINNNPLVNLYIDGKLIAEKVEAVNTGSWSIYVNQEFARTVIGRGKHKFRLEFVNDGFSWVSFSIQSSTKEAVVDYREGIIELEEDLKGFEDIKGHWAETQINSLRENKIIRGKTKNIFAPEDTLSLYEAVWIAMRSFGIEYSDETWADTAKFCGIYNDEEDMPVTREKFIEIMMNAYEYSNDTYEISINEIPFTDWNDVDAAYYNQIRGAYKLGLLEGDPNGKLRPKSTLTRAEAATVISRLYN